MQRLEPTPIGDIMRLAIQDSQMTEHFEELRAAAFWPAIVGQEIADMCLRPFVKAGKMSIRVPDAALRNELNMSRSLIIREFNRLAGKEVIKQLRFYS